MGDDNDDDGNGKPQVYADNGWISVKVKGQDDDDLDDVVEKAKEMTDYMSDNAVDHRENPEGGFQ